jgi:hypothetical protein
LGIEPDAPNASPRRERRGLSALLVSASTVKQYETSDDHFVSIKSSSGAADSVRRADSGRNEVVLRRRQRQWKSRGLASLKVPNKVWNDRV